MTALDELTLKKLREVFPEYSRVKLVDMDDPNAPPNGIHGTVIDVDDMGTIHVSWDNGSSLGVVWGVDKAAPLNNLDKLADEILLAMLEKQKRLNAIYEVESFFEKFYAEHRGNVDDERMQDLKNSIEHREIFLRGKISGMNFSLLCLTNESYGVYCDRVTDFDEKCFERWKKEIEKCL